MQLIRDIHRARQGSGRPVISFEFFPPKTDEGERVLLENTVPELLRLKPDFCSVTYGAGGSTRDKTLGIAARIQREHDLTVMSHLTCAGSTREQIREYVENARRQGIENFLALRGDPPGGVGEFQRTEGGFEYSYQLVTFLREMGGLSLGTAGFPEGHISCREGKHVDWQRLKAKIDCGADFVLTQLFFDNHDFFEFRDYMVKQGVTIPICPGILPIVSGPQIKRFTTLCGAKLPPAVVQELERLGDDDEAAAKFGIDYAVSQCQELLKRGVPGMHFYPLNRTAAPTAILRRLGLG